MVQSVIKKGSRTRILSPEAVLVAMSATKEEAKLELTLELVGYTSLKTNSAKGI